ncbi:MAG: Dolichyl-phosphate-mannose--protein O-mannosyl transferase [Verrucomicrobia bacterium]|nr:MAG: Dolichyl-phosphate-mannose--protein O-mannosyl transferase [Verrucomicrobiota bacterium]
MPPNEETKAWGKSSALLLAVILAYAALVFFNLGSWVSPQTLWAPPPKAKAVFDLGSEKKLGKLSFFYGLGTGTFSVEWSVDGEDWVPAPPIVNEDRFAELRWRSVSLETEARYLRLQLLKGNLELLELHLDSIAAPRLMDGESAATRLFDEPETFAPGASFYDGMYFDEIYHAKSGWEIARGIDATENSHPPLGKILMAASIRCFGMTPFGYRFVGAFFSVLMLALVFGLAKRLTLREDLAHAATIFFALDFMHFTQARMATLDTIVVLFILAAYYFLLRYLQAPEAPANRTNADLCLVLSGFSIGLGIATKWNAIYAAGGMVAFYLVHWWSRVSRPTVRDIMLAFVTFVALPISLYILSFVPFLMLPGKTFSEAFHNQGRMWAFHSGITATHPYSSFWFEWPLLKKPIWYFRNITLPPNQISSIQCFGNPIIWSLGCLSILSLAARLAWTAFKPAARPVQRMTPPPPRSKRAERRARKGAHTCVEQAPPPAAAINPATAASPQSKWTVQHSGHFVLWAALAQYVPWAIIPRKLLFIYHFYATIPFLVLALVLELQSQADQRPNLRHFHWWVGGAAALCFLACFPILSGAVVSREWGILLRNVFHTIYL